MVVDRDLRSPTLNVLTQYISYLNSLVYHIFKRFLNLFFTKNSRRGGALAPSMDTPPLVVPLPPLEVREQFDFLATAASSSTVVVKELAKANASDWLWQITVALGRSNSFKLQSTRLQGGQRLSMERGQTLCTRVWLGPGYQNAPTPPKIITSRYWCLVPSSNVFLTIRF